MNYLIYIEHSAENLQFFLWYKDYVKRFNNLPDNEKALAPTWTAPDPEAEPKPTTPGLKQHISSETAAAFKGTDFAGPIASVTEVKSNPFNTPPLTPKADTQSLVSEIGWSPNASTLNVSHKTAGSHQKQAAGAFEDANVKFQPCMPHLAHLLSKTCAELNSHYPAIQRRDCPYHYNLHQG